MSNTPCSDDESGYEMHRKFASIIRAHALRITHRAKSGHIGSMLSAADVISVLYNGILKVDPANPKWPERDRFILSKGHAGGILYSALAEKGFFTKELLDTYCLNGAELGGHISHFIPGVELSTGSLGHGLPVALGMALAARRTGKKHRVFCLMSEGDCDAGSTWEAILMAAQHKVDNLVGIVDYNRVQALDFVENVIKMEPFAAKMRACGWAVNEVDGHDVRALDNTLQKLPFEKDKPSWLICRTTKGKGVSFMENTVVWHYNSVNDQQLQQALAELGEK